MYLSGPVVEQIMCIYIYLPSLVYRFFFFLELYT